MHKRLAAEIEESAETAAESRGNTNFIVSNALYFYLLVDCLAQLTPVDEKEELVPQKFLPCKKAE